MQHRAVRFTATAAGYRRLWLRNVAINIALAGFYTPVVRKRTAQFFASHTLVDGSALEAVERPTGSRWRLLVIGALYLASRIATDLGYGPPLPALVLAGVVLIPFFWGSMTRMRVGSTRWRDVQLQFTARWPEVYRASWPLFAIGLPWAAVVSRVAASTQGARPHLELQTVALLAAAAAAAFPLLVALAFNYRRLAVTRTRAGNQEVRWAARYRDYLRIWLGTSGAFALSVVPAGMLVRYAVFGDVAGPAGWTGPAAVAVPLLTGLLAVVLSAPARAWHEARMFVLLWDGLQVGDAARFECRLAPRSLVRLRTKNMLRSLATLGWYRPQGIVDEYRLKAESVSLVGA
jgi:uncharacterized membrane protein YjgN (DUF898 family)